MANLFLILTLILTENVQNCYLIDLVPMVNILGGKILIKQYFYNPLGGKNRLLSTDL